MAAEVWVATAPIWLGNVRAYNLNNVVPDSVVAQFGLEAEGLVERRAASDTGVPSHGVDPATQQELDAVIGSRAAVADVFAGDGKFRADKIPASVPRTINGKTATGNGDLVLTAGDVGALPGSTTAADIGALDQNTGDSRYVQPATMNAALYGKEDTGRSYVYARDYAGYDPTGASDSTAAINAAINVALTTKARVLLLNGTPACTGINPGATNQGLTIRGLGKNRSTRIDFTGTSGALVENGSDNGQPHDDHYFDGPQGLYIENLTLNVKNPTTTTANGLASYTPGTYGIRDWRGGDVILNHVCIEGFDYPFWGMQSDLNRWNDVFVSGAHSGIYIGPRSDQFSITDLYAVNSDRALDIDSAHGVWLRNAVFVSCGIQSPLTTVATDLATTNGSATITSATANFTAADIGRAVVGTGIPPQTIITAVASATSATMGQFATATATDVTLQMPRAATQAGVRVRSQYSRRARQITFDTPWFESQTSLNGTIAAFVEIGIGDTYQTQVVTLRDPYVLIDAVPNGNHVQYLADIDNADGVTVENLGGYWTALDRILKLSGTTAATQHRVLQSLPTSAANGRIFDVLQASTASPPPRVLMEVYGNTQGSAPAAYKEIRGGGVGVQTFVDPVGRTGGMAGNAAGFGTFWQVMGGMAGSASGRRLFIDAPNGFQARTALGSGNAWIGWDPTTGTTVGEPAGKLGFLGAAPIVRPTGTPADATDLASAITLLNFLKAKLIALGLIG